MLRCASPSFISLRLCSLHMQAERKSLCQGEAMHGKEPVCHLQEWQQVANKAKRAGVVHDVRLGRM